MTTNIYCARSQIAVLRKCNLTANVEKNGNPRDILAYMAAVFKILLALKARFMPVFSIAHGIAIVSKSADLCFGYRLEVSF